jgi:hypothetical protein
MVFFWFQLNMENEGLLNSYDFTFLNVRDVYVYYETLTKTFISIVWLYSSPRPNIKSASTKLKSRHTSQLIAHTLSEKPQKYSNTLTSSTVNMDTD